MKQYTFILFDLDGTLTDPKEGITKSVAYALESFGIHVENRECLCKFIGPPLKDSFVNFYGFEEAQAEAAVEKYREYFRPFGLFENRVYDGVEKLLRALTEDGKTLILATSKPTVFAEQILEHFHLRAFFSHVIGSELDGTRVKKGDVIAYALEQAGISDKSRAVMVGDREHDIIGAKENGLDSIGVLYGYGTLEEFQKCGADAVAESVEELKGLLQ